MKLATIFLIFILVSSPAIATLGISHEPLTNRELELPRGENYLFKLTYQNTNEEPITINITVESEIAELVGPGLANIPAQSTNKFSLINISVPSSSSVGDTFRVGYTITPVEEESGQVPLNFRYDRSITVVVGEGEAKNAEVSLEGLVEEEQNNILIMTILGVAVVLIILLVVAIVWRKSKQLSEHVKQEHTHAKHPFIFADGTKIHSLQELKTNIKKKPEIAKKHIRDGTNDFATWVESELKKKELANKVREKVTTNDILKSLSK